jgi:hypothetical protein
MGRIEATTVAESSDERVDRVLRLLPSPLALLVIGLGGILFSITLASGAQDPDYFWHVTTGELIVSTGMVPTTDPYSFTWAGQAWTLHEWLSEVVIYGLLQTVGEAGTRALFALIPVAILAILGWSLARRGVSVAAFALAAAPVAFVLVPYVTVRPQAISWLMLAALMAFLMELSGRRRWWAMLIVPYFALWANLHGLWVVGLGVVAAYALFTMVGRTPMAAARGWVLAGALGAVAATALTPAGPAGMLYPLRYVNAGDWGLANIREWQSPDFHDPIYLGFLVLIVAVMLNAGRATRGWLVLVSSVGIVMGLVSARNVPLAALFALPTLAFGVEDRLAAWWPATGKPKRPAIALVRRLMEAALAVIVVITALVLTRPTAPGLMPDPSRYPVAAMDRLLAINPSARIFAEYGWGGYVISRSYEEGGRVFVDGRNDMYDDTILETYSAIRAAEGDWQTELDGWDVGAVLLPSDAPLVRGPLEAAGWCVAHRDALAILFLRDCP